MPTKTFAAANKPINAIGAALSVALLGLAGQLCATPFPAHPVVAGNTTLNPNDWSIDRFAPRVFSTAPQVLGRVNVLTIGMDAADGPTTRPPAFTGNFYNIQGRHINFPSVQTAGTTVAGSLFIPAAWNTSTLASPSDNRRSELLVQLTPQLTDACIPAGDCIYFGAIGFSNAQVLDQLAGGGPPRIRILKKGVGDGWIDLTTPFVSNAWNDFCVAFTGPTLEYYLNGALVFTDTSLVAPDPTAGAPTRVRSATVESYNFGSTFGAQWADLEYGARASLEISRAGAATAIVGSSYSVVTTVRNTGPTGATNVQVIEPTVSGLSLSSVSGACSALPCVLGTLAAGDMRSFTTSYSVTTGATIVSTTALVRTDGVDCTKSNNSATVTAAVGVPVVRMVPGLNLIGLLLLMLGLIGAVGYQGKGR
jgi:uncharacterized repeat protein (TIGR01451 family)